MTPEVENIMRLASLMATRRVRQFACLRPDYRGAETEAGTTQGVADAKAALLQAVEALSRDSANSAFDNVLKSHERLVG